MNTERQQFAVLVEHTNDGFVALSREFRITFLNRAAEQMLRRERSSLLGLKVTEVFPWMRGSESMQNFERCMRERINLRWETYARAASTWIQVHAYPTDEGIAFVVHDIGERKHAELELRASEERYRTLANLLEATQAHFRQVFKQIPVPFVVLRGPHHEYELTSDTCDALLGRSVVGMTVRDAISNAEARDTLLRLFDDVYATGAPREVRARRTWIDARGSAGEAFFDVFFRALRDERGVVYGITGVGIEVTEQQRAHAEAEAARAEVEHERGRLARVLEQAPFSVMITTGPAHVIYSVNRMARSAFGARAVAGLPMREAFPAAAGTILGNLDRAFAGEAVVLQAMPFRWDRRRIGQVEDGFFDSIYQPIIDGTGKVEGVLIFGLDVTDSVRSREAIDAHRAEAEAARSAIQRAHEELEQKIQLRTAELAQTNRALAEEIAERVKSEAVQRDLSRLLARAREDEQRRTARDLHDQVGQTLTALTLAIKAARNSEGLSDELSGRLAEVQRVAENLGRDVHELASRLRPAVLDDLGLNAALHQLVMDWERSSGVAVDLQTSGTGAERWSAEVETVLYRVVQEALTNVARHARATHVSVVVEGIEGQAVAIVEDDGVGFDHNRVGSERLGVAGMQERVRLLGGHFALESTPGVGTTVIARLPRLPAKQEGA